MSSSQVERLRESMRVLVRRFGALSEDATPCGKPLSVAHAHALQLLEERGELSQLQLGEWLGIDKSNVARLCAKMVEAGHAVMRTSEQDARSRLVELSARGKRLAEEVEVASRERFGLLLEALPARSRGSVLSALEQLVEALETLPRRDAGEER